MTFVKRELKTGDKITQDYLDNIENGISINDTKVNEHEEKITKNTDDIKTNKEAIKKLNLKPSVTHDKTYADYEEFKSNLTLETSGTLINSSNITITDYKKIEYDNFTYHTGGEIITDSGYYKVALVKNLDTSKTLVVPYLVKVLFLDANDKPITIDNPDPKAANNYLIREDTYVYSTCFNNYVEIEIPQDASGAYVQINRKDTISLRQKEKGDNIFKKDYNKILAARTENLTEADCILYARDFICS